MQTCLAMRGFALFQQDRKDRVFINHYEGYGQRQIMRFLRGQGYTLRARRAGGGLYRDADSYVSVIHAGSGQLIVSHFNGEPGSPIVSRPSSGWVWVKSKYFWAVLLGLMLGVFLSVGHSKPAAPPEPKMLLLKAAPNSDELSARRRKRNKQRASRYDIEQGDAEPVPLPVPSPLKAYNELTVSEMLVAHGIQRKQEENEGDKYEIIEMPPVDQIYAPIKRFDVPPPSNALGIIFGLIGLLLVLGSVALIAFSKGERHVQ